MWKVWPYNNVTLSAYTIIIIIPLIGCGPIMCLGWKVNLSDNCCQLYKARVKVLKAYKWVYHSALYDSSIRVATAASATLSGHLHKDNTWTTFMMIALSIIMCRHISAGKRSEFICSLFLMLKPTPLGNNSYKTCIPRYPDNRTQLAA